MRITVDQKNRIKYKIKAGGFTIQGWCRIHNLDHKLFYRWLSGEPLFKNQIGNAFKRIVENNLGISL